MYKQERKLNVFWYKFFGGMIMKDVMPIIFTAIAISLAWCFILTLLLIK